ncbi:MAG: transcriptional regulator [Candidatus Diapherotrites archaeon CG10_big_fil_rev_8_21_14_0_10_31_34]|nr:MAG: transcriptional regulator [Candidatus Diapherotrites archaeon CG10_big_fil_rev_8_21_14_0_10_31_34]
MNKKCPVFVAAGLIGKKWSLEILVQLCKNKLKPKRYSEIRRNLNNVNPRSLSIRLKNLEKSGLIKKKISAKTFPIKSEYSLTESGKDFIKVIKEIKEWAIKWKNHNALCKGIDCVDCKN